jgi:peptide/nickel transport system substrate-binding protein
MLKLNKLLCAILIIGTILIGCTPNQAVVQGEQTATSPAATESAATGGRLVVALDYSDIAYLDPVVPDDNSSIWTILNIYDQMFRVAADGKSIEPDMVKDYAISSDGLTYTFNLRPGVTFSDGTPVTVDDVVFSMQRMIAAENWGFLFPSDTIVEASGDNAVVFRLSEPYAPLINNLAGFWSSIVPKKLVESQGDAFWERPVASGPFMVNEWVKGDHLTLVRNPYYWEAGKPYLDEVELRPGMDDNTRVLKLESGELDVLVQVPFNQLKPLDDLDGITSTTSPLFSFERIFINGKNPPLDELNVRLALNYATDKQAIIDSVMNGIGTPATTIISQIPFWDADAPGFPYDLQKAKDLMAQSSVPNGFDVTMNYRTGNTVDEQVLVMMQQQWSLIGVNMNIEPLDPALLSENFGSGLYQVRVSYSTSDVLDPSETISIVVCDRTQKWQDFCDQQLDTLFNDAMKEMDVTKREQMYKQIQERANELAYWIPLFYLPNRYAYWDYVKNLNVLPTGNIRLWELRVQK